MVLPTPSLTIKILTIVHITIPSAELTVLSHADYFNPHSPVLFVTETTSHLAFLSLLQSFKKLFLSEKK